jgi:hypothetical protein
MRDVLDYRLPRIWQKRCDRHFRLAAALAQCTNRHPWSTQCEMIPEKEKEKSPPVRLAGTADFRIADMQKATNGAFVGLALRLRDICAYQQGRSPFFRRSRAFNFKS